VFSLLIDVSRLLLWPLAFVLSVVLARETAPRCTNRPWAASLPPWLALDCSKPVLSAAGAAADGVRVPQTPPATTTTASRVGLRDGPTLSWQPAVECACSLQLLPVIVQHPLAECTPPIEPVAAADASPRLVELSSAMALSVSPSFPVGGPSGTPPVQAPLIPHRIFQNAPSSLASPSSVHSPFPHIQSRPPIILVLDLDETLVHSSLRPLPDADFFVETQLDRGRAVFHVIKRPFMHQFLETILSWPEYRVAFFTASLRAYAEPVMDVIDPLGRISLRYFRDSCDQEGGNFSKNLVRLGMDPARSIIIDNSPVAYTRCRPNAIPIDSFFGNDPSDHQLLAILPLLDALRHVRDVRSILSLRTGSLVS